MQNHYTLENKMVSFQSELQKAAIDTALITNEDNVYYLTGYYDYLHMDFGRPTILIVPSDGETRLITPHIDLNTAHSCAKVDKILPWQDGIGKEWRQELSSAILGKKQVAIEANEIPQIIRNYIKSEVHVSDLENVTPILEKMRMIKDDSELQLARHAGLVANAMMEAGRKMIADGVPEFEVAIACSQAGTRKAATLLAEHYTIEDMSPNTHFLQIMASGDKITRTHHRATNRIMKHGEPVFLCFCGMTNFHKFKLGFDRTLWIGEIVKKSQADIYKIALASQKAALEVLRPGIKAETVHAAYSEVIRNAGFEFPFRCGRGTGFSYLEAPQLVAGDKTILKPGMVLAVDGSVSSKDFRAQIGDSFIITQDGHEELTSHPKDIEELIL